MARTPSIAPRSYLSSDGLSRGAFNSQMNRALPHVRAQQAGGYEDVNIPNPNSAMAIQGLFASGASPTHLGNGMSASEYNAASATRVGERREALQKRDRDAGGLRSVIGGLSTVPTDKRWDAFFGGLQNVGADELQSGAAAGMDMGPSVYDMRTGTSYQQARPGFYDTQVRQQQQAYDPREAQAGTMPGNAPFNYAQGQMANTARQAIGGLRSGFSAYDPQAGSELLRNRRRQQVPMQANPDAERRNYEIAKENAAKEERAAYLDQQDALRGRTNVRRR